MRDVRMTELAKLLIEHSTAMQAGEHLLIEAFDAPDAMVIELINACRARGAHPHVVVRSSRILRSLVEGGDETQFEVMGQADLDRMKRMDAYIGLRGGFNVNEMSGVPEDRLKAWGAL
ncbi:MAG: aminopeptidase, partial [Phycisphaerae bacterium]|nr:aminopeptidase [Phycisphaerae bacterium]